MMLEDKVAVVYGAGGAIGGAVARAFACEGARVFLAGRLGATVEAVARDVVSAGGSAEAAQVDALDEQAVDRHLQSVIGRAGRVDVSFNAAGVPDTKILGVPLAELDAGQFNLTQSLRALLARRGAVVIVRWGLAELPGVLDELSISRPLLISTERWRHVQLPVHDRFHGVRAHAEIAGVKAAHDAAGGADGLIALGGGSAIDTAKAVSSETGLPVVSIPTTYSGAEWTSGYGMRDRSTGRKLGGGGARTVAIVYELELTLDLPARESAGTAMNALAHCAEALYTTGRGEETDAEALAGAPLISRWLPVVPATATTSRRGEACSRGRCTPARRSVRGRASATRWRRRSAAATGSRTGR